MPHLITFLEGVITFVSPCILPLLPVYVAFFAGGGAGGGTRAALVRALGFVLGFGALFCLLGVFAGSFGALVAQYQRLLDAVCGAVMVLFGLGYMGLVRLGPLERTVRLKGRPAQGLAGSVAFGVVFGLGWTPCVGTFLASALSLAASSGSAVYGMTLLASYVAGFGLPFVVSALLIDQLESTFTWVREHYASINRACGAVLVLMGVLMLTGYMGTWLRLLSSVA